MTELLDMLVLPILSTYYVPCKLLLSYCKYYDQSSKNISFRIDKDPMRLKAIQYSFLPDDRNMKLMVIGKVHTCSKNTNIRTQFIIFAHFA